MAGFVASCVNNTLIPSLGELLGAGVNGAGVNGGGAVRELTCGLGLYGNKAARIQVC